MQCECFFAGAQESVRTTSSTGFSDGAFVGMTSEQRTRVLRTIRSLNVDYAISADRRGLLAGEDVSYLNSRVSTRAKDIQLDTRWSKMFV